MSAQYRPYRDEELDGDNMHWSDQEPGTVQIYEKTRDETFSVTARTLVVGGIGIALLGALLGLLIGYFAHYVHSECVPGLSVALHSVRDEDPGISRKIMEMVDIRRIKDDIEKFSTHPRVAGFKSDYDLAELVKNKFQDHGLDKVTVSDYNTLLSYPSCENPNKVLIMDDDDIIHTVQQQECSAGIAPYSAYSPKGKIKGDLVFINYGQPSDYRQIKEIDLKGKILIAKHDFPAKQAWDAYQKGAAGLLLYPDPMDYNPPALNMSPYPESWWLPGDGTIWSSILWNGFGDPQTTAFPAVKHAQRLASNEMVLPHIPVQPISYNEARLLLKFLSGKKAPELWQGGFDFPVNVGPGFNETLWKVYLEINNKMINKTVRNVFGYVKGKVEPDRYVLIGSHRDAWANGAVDSASGTAALLELSTVFGDLLKTGWRPRRTIIFCNWGAEEFNLMGSTEWLEEHSKVLNGRAVAYINADVLVLGNTSLRVSASPLLYHVIFNATKQVLNPNEEEISNGLHTVYDSWRQTFPLERNVSTLIFPEEATGDTSFLDYDEFFPLEPETESSVKLLDNYMRSSMLKVRPRIHALNQKGTYATFLHAGIPAVDLSYIHDTRPSHAAYPLRHTKYDEFSVIEKYIDPEFKYHAAVVKVLGELLRDLSDSLFLPFNLFDYAQVLHEFYLSMKDNQLLTDQTDLGLLNSSVSNFTAAALNFHTLQEKLDLSDPMIIRRINDQLLLLERIFFNPSGFSYYIQKRYFVPSLDGTTYDTFSAVLEYFFNLSHQAAEAQRPEDIRTMLSFLILTIQSGTAAIQEVV